MSDFTGVYKTTKKDNSIYYRVSITYKGKHISLGSFSNEIDAQNTYVDARNVLDTDCLITDYDGTYTLSHDKFIILLNFRDNGIYFSTPIYLRKHYFEYYLSQHEILKFDRDDLFFYSTHKIQKKGGYLFVADYGSQYKIMSRYGIKPFAVYGRDYYMINGDKLDFRYSNIEVINNFNGVTRKQDSGKTIYIATININGAYIIGKYDEEITAAVAYNKAVDTLNTMGFTKNFSKNYIETLTSEEYKSLYKSIRISKKIYNTILNN